MIIMPPRKSKERILEIVNILQARIESGDVWGHVPQLGVCALYDCAPLDDNVFIDCKNCALSEQYEHANYKQWKKERGNNDR